MDGESDNGGEKVEERRERYLKKENKSKEAMRVEESEEEEQEGWKRMS